MTCHESRALTHLSWEELRERQRRSQTRPIGAGEVCVCVCACVISYAGTGPQKVFAPLGSADCLFLVSKEIDP